MCPVTKQPMMPGFVERIEVLARAGAKGPGLNSQLMRCAPLGQANGVWLCFVVRSSLVARTVAAVS
jgi:hypothetical protein